MPELLPVTSYSTSIDLNVPFRRIVETRFERSLLLREIAAWLLADSGLTSDIPRDDSETRRLIRKLLTVRPARPIPDGTLALFDQLFGAEASERPVTTLEQALLGADEARRVGSTRVHVWRGDITRLVVDAIVNAANADLLGCFRPEHACIDNAIHSAAGPRLREDCRRIIDIQGHKEPTGTSKATRAYFLPSKFVLHTVGPIVGNGQVAPDHRASLATCYESCLDVAAAIPVRSVAFCAISTGVFGYPKLEAAKVATTTVRRWLESHEGRFDAVIFNVFGESDHEAYRQTWTAEW